MYRIIKISALVVLILCHVMPFTCAQERFYLPGADTSLVMPDNYKVRQKYSELIFFSLYRAQNAKERIWEDDGASKNSGESIRVKFTTITKDDNLIFLFLNEKNGDFPMTGRGNVSIMRSISSSQVYKMTILLRDQNNCYLRLMPADGKAAGERTEIDIFLFGRRIYHNLIIPMPFETLLFESFTTIVRHTNKIVDWESILYKGIPGESVKGIRVFDAIRKFLPRLHTVDDGAMNENGTYVFIETLELQKGPGGFNCSGFAKWIVDGFYFDLTGKYMEIDPLKEKMMGQRGNKWSTKYEDKRDPYFGLDWTRNLSRMLYKAQSGETDVDPEISDVRYIPSFEYIEDAGYPVSDLEFILFFLAKENPDCFYLGSVNKEIGGSMKLRQHYHIAVFFPYFTAKENPEIIVMEKNKEIDLASFINKYRGNEIHLVKFPIRGNFHPPKP